MGRIGIENPEEFLRARTGILKGNLKKGLQRIFKEHAKQLEVTEALLKKVTARVTKKQAEVESI